MTITTWDWLKKQTYKTKAGAERARKKYTPRDFFRVSKSRKTGLFSIKERR